MAMSRFFAGRSVTCSAPMYTSPAVTSSRPATMRRIVDLPQPDGPTSTMNSPSSVESETSFTAMTSEPNRFVMPSSTIRAISSHLPLVPAKSAPVAAPILTRRGHGSQDVSTCDAIDRLPTQAYDFGRLDMSVTVGYGSRQGFRDEPTRRPHVGGTHHDHRR